jgi:hypothetical protein
VVGIPAAEIASLAGVCRAVRSDADEHP